MDVEWYFLFCYWPHSRFPIWCFFIISSYNTSSCYDNNIWFPWFSKDILYVRIRVLGRILIPQFLGFPCRNEMREFLNNMIKIFTIRTCCSRIYAFPRKVFNFPTIITYRLASSMTKSSSSSSTYENSTPLG